MTNGCINIGELKVESDKTEVVHYSQAHQPSAEGLKIPYTCM